MNRVTVIGLLVAGSLLAAPRIAAAPADVDALVQQVREEALREAAHDEERINRFLAEKDEQQRLLTEARARLAAENRRADNLRGQYEENEATLTQYEFELQERAGDLNDLFAIEKLAPNQMARRACDKRRVLIFFGLRLS